MILLNFSHPLTQTQLEQIEALTGQAVERVVDSMPQLDHEMPFDAQIGELVDRVGLSPQEWQTKPLLVNPPGYASAAVVLLAEMHGRMGHFPAVLRLRPVPDSNPPQYEMAEVVNLQALRDRARERRWQAGGVK
jgi:hypothetical protein